MLRLGSVPQLLLGIGLLGLAGALLLNQPLAGRTAARTVIFSPVVLSGVAIGIVWIYIGLPAEKQQAAVKWITFATSPEITTFWAKTTGYMPVRKRAAQSAEMQVYFKERPTFKTAVDQLPKTRPQDAARVFVPNGDQIIGKGLARIIVNKEDVAKVFGDVNKELETAAAPVIIALKAVEG